jgi:hypothetical protein
LGVRGRVILQILCHDPRVNVINGANVRIGAIVSLACTDCFAAGNDAAPRSRPPTCEQFQSGSCLDIPGTSGGYAGMRATRRSHGHHISFTGSVMRGEGS